MLFRFYGYFLHECATTLKLGARIVHKTELHLFGERNLSHCHAIIGSLLHQSYFVSCFRIDSNSCRRFVSVFG